MPRIDAHALVVVGIRNVEERDEQFLRTLVRARKAGCRFMLDNLIGFKEKLFRVVVTAPMRVVREFIVIECGGR